MWVSQVTYPARLCSEDCLPCPQPLSHNYWFLPGKNFKYKSKLCLVRMCKREPAKYGSGNILHQSCNKSVETLTCSAAVNVMLQSENLMFSGGYKHHNWLIYSFIRKPVRDLKMKDWFSVLIWFYFQDGHQLWWENPILPSFLVSGCLCVWAIFRKYSKTSLRHFLTVSSGIRVY